MAYNFFRKRFSLRWTNTLMALFVSTIVLGQNIGEKTAEELVALGFENVRWTETDNEIIYTIENTAYKIQEAGIAKAIQTIQSSEMPKGKTCKVIVTRQEIPEMTLTYENSSEDFAKWQASYDITSSWKEVKKKDKKNSSRYKVDIIVYPSLSFQNMDISKVYQVMFSLNPAIEISLWPGMRLSGQVILPLIVDTKGYAAYSPLYKKVRPGFMTLAQRFRLPFNIKGKGTIGYFNQDQYGLNMQLFRPFKDERFSLEAQLGYTGWGYWDAFSLKYNDQYQWTWSVGGNFFWSQYDTQFSLKAQQYLLGERGIRFDMVRHFKYASVGFYAMKAKEANSNGGFLFQIALPPYKLKRHKYIPRVNTSMNMGIMYNAGNERIYYRQHRVEINDKLMEENGFNPVYIENKLSNY